MKTNFEFVKNLFNKGEKLPSFENTNNYQINFYRVEISFENKIQLESGCISEHGERFFNYDLREYTPSLKEFNKLERISKGKTVFFIYED